MWKFVTHFTRFYTEKEHNFTFHVFFLLVLIPPGVGFFHQTKKIGIELNEFPIVENTIL